MPTQNGQKVLPIAHKLWDCEDVEKVAAAYYLAAMIDGEGCVSFGKTSAMVSIVNTDKSIIRATREALDTLGIVYTIFEPKSTNVKYKKRWVINICRKTSFDLLWDWVPIQSEMKSLKLLAAKYRKRTNGYLES